MSLTPEALSAGQQRSLEELKGRTKRRVGGVLLVVSILCIALFSYCSFTASKRLSDYQQQRSRLITLRTPQVMTLVAAGDDYTRWFRNHGTSYEFSTFNAAAALVYSGLLSVAGEEDGTQVNGIVVSIAATVLRLAFILLGSLRIWLLAIVIGVVWKIWHFKPHDANEFLGQTGNGRYYYSGIRAALDKVADDGAPDIHIRGLICLPEVDAAAVDKSALLAVLRQYDCINGTNRELIGILLAHSQYPAFVADGKEHSSLSAMYADEGLVKQTEQLLRELLAAHRGVMSAQEKDPTAAAATPSDVPALSSSGGRVGPQVYGQMFARACLRVLPPSLEKAFAGIPSSHVATAVLAMQAAKCLAFTKEGGRWYSKTSFLQLSARAVLHSTANYGHEYTYRERQLIRQALIYASRRSAFGPVPLPVVIDQETQSLRACAELMLALPSELDVAADRVELYCLCWELEKRFRQRFIAGFKEGRDELVQGVFYSRQDMLFVPLANILTILLQVVPADVVERIDTLVTRLTEKLGGESLVDDLPNEPEARLPVYARVLAPFSSAEVQQLAADHELKPKDLQRWSPLRMILFSYSWLGQQIGHVAVPDSSLVFTIMKPETAHPARNHLGLIGGLGMVPIRCSRLIETIGQSWKQKCTGVASIAIADSKADYEALLAGREAKGSEDLGSKEPLAV